MSTHHLTINLSVVVNNVSHSVSSLRKVDYRLAPLGLNLPLNAGRFSGAVVFERSARGGVGCGGVGCTVSTGCSSHKAVSVWIGTTGSVACWTNTQNPATSLHYSNDVCILLRSESVLLCWKCFPAFRQSESIWSWPPSSSEVAFMRQSSVSASISADSSSCTRAAIWSNLALAADWLSALENHSTYTGSAAAAPWSSLTGDEMA